MSDPFDAPQGDPGEEPDDELDSIELEELDSASEEAEFDDEDVQQGEEARLEFTLHPALPIPVGGRTHDGLITIERPSINIDRARKPATPGLPALWLPPLPSPSALKLAPPPGVTPIQPVREHATSRPAERITFPVPEAPSFEALGSRSEALTEQPGARTALKADTPRAQVSHVPVIPPRPVPAPTPSEEWEEEERVAVGDRIDPLVPLIFISPLSPD
jgi:hypothetical protein